MYSSSVLGFVCLIMFLVFSLVFKLGTLCSRSNVPLSLWCLLAMVFTPIVSATSDHSAFPDITFKAFSGFIESNFSSRISLATVLLLLYTMTDNPDLLSLHARQQNPQCVGENNTKLSAWIKSLARSVSDRLGERDVKMLFQKKNYPEDKISAIADKLDGLSKCLDLTPYNKNGKYIGQLKPVSYKEIEPVLVICPNSVNCEDMDCEPRGLLQSSEIRDIPLVTLIKNTTSHKNVMVLAGKCIKCKTIYQADHERLIKPNTQPKRAYVNSAKYLKVGQSIWVDRVFSTAILNGMYSFHASASAYTEFWNNSYGNIDKDSVTTITRRQVWQAFIQESIRTVASEANDTLCIQDGLSISEKTKAAFEQLGSNGVIHIADGHSCAECTQKYKSTADILPDIDPSATVGIDEGKNLPTLTNIPIVEDKDKDKDTLGDTMSSSPDPEDAPVKLVVVDGIVMGPTVSNSSFCYK